MQVLARATNQLPWKEAQGNEKSGSGAGSTESRLPDVLLQDGSPVFLYVDSISRRLFRQSKNMGKAALRLCLPLRKEAFPIPII